MTAKNGYIAHSSNGYTAQELERYTDAIIQEFWSYAGDVRGIDLTTLEVHGSSNYNIRVRVKADLITEIHLDALSKALAKSGFKVLKIDPRRLNKCYATAYPYHFEVGICWIDGKPSMVLEAWY